MSAAKPSGPLAGLRVVEFASIGPGPHAAMLLSDLGAEVLRIDRPSGNGFPNPVMDRGRHRLVADIRSEAGRAQAIEAVELADVLIEGLRPGVMERLGLGPDDLLARNPRLIYGRMTGWGQEGPLAKAAGHDINYIALTGALAGITGDDRRPIPPLNLVGDFGGGSMFLVMGILAALYERERSGKGQVVDAAIVDGVASMMTMFSGLIAGGYITLDPERNMLGGSAPFYRCYECADGRHISVGAIELQFYAELMDRLGAPDNLRAGQHAADEWPQKRAALADMFKRKTRQEWCELLEGTDVCFAPVLTYEESLSHPHMQARAAYVTAEGLAQAAPAPRFSRTAGAIQQRGEGGALLERWKR